MPRKEEEIPALTGAGALDKGSFQDLRVVTLPSLKVDPIFSFFEARGTQRGPGDPGESQEAPREPWVPLPWLSPGSPWPSLGAPGLQKRKNGIYF